MSEAPRFRPEEVLARLNAASVDYIVIGGLASQVHGSPSITRDLDVCIARDLSNLQRLAEVLADIAAIRRGLPPDSPPMPPLDARTLRGGSLFTLDTAFGPFDLLANPDPGFDFETLRRNAITVEVGGAAVKVASLDDLMAMKRAAGRPKDRIELEILGALREEIDRRSA
jgi:predicted nucleotidyltransferase